MSELKRFDIVGKYADEETVYEFRPDGECYDADEVDKVIAEKDAFIVQLRGEVTRYRDAYRLTKYQLDAAIKEINELKEKTK